MSKIIFGFLGMALLCGCQNQQLYREARVLMGTFVEVTSPQPQALGIVFKEISRIENLLSKYKPESEIARLNRSGKLKVSPDTYFIIKKAKEFWLGSGGAFDITVGPLMDIWGFTDKQYRLPSDEEIKTALTRVGFDKIILNDSDNVVQFSVSGMRLDLGAIAKGYAVDCAVKRLKEAGIRSCLINAGGQIYALGYKFFQPWAIGVKHPRTAGTTVNVALRDESVSTSGDYEQYFVKDNRRYAHVFNPKTGYPVDSGVISVTVIAPDGTTTDALSTSIFVLGKEKGEALLKKFPQARIINLVSKRF